VHVVEERKFLYGLCSKALGIDSSILFTGVVNDYGKLIVGLPRLFGIQKDEIVDDSIFKTSQNSLYYNFSNDNDGLYSIENMKNITVHFDIKNRSEFQLINVTKNKYIAFASLTEIHDKYLCIYFKANKSVSNTIIKLNTIFE
jgi:hypothetical protein